MTEDLAEITQYFAVHAPWHELSEALGLRVCKVAIYHPHAAEALYPRLAPLATAERRVILSGPEWVDVQHVRIDKANALAALLRRQGLRPELSSATISTTRECSHWSLTPWPWPTPCPSSANAPPPSPRPTHRTASSRTSEPSG